MKDFDTICGEIREERERQIEKWSDGIRNADTMIRVIGEEFGEVCRAVNDDDASNYREEFVQLAACCVKAIQCFDREKEAAEDHH